eukprot:780527-Amphidinium_carterae.3
MLVAVVLASQLPAWSITLYARWTMLDHDDLLAPPAALLPLVHLPFNFLVKPIFLGDNVPPIMAPTSPPPLITPLLSNSAMLPVLHGVMSPAFVDLLGPRCLALAGYVLPSVTLLAQLAHLCIVHPSATSSASLVARPCCTGGIACVRSNNVTSPNSPAPSQPHCHILTYNNLTLAVFH